MLVGYASEDITPTSPLSLLGQSYERLGHHARDPTVNAAVFDESPRRAAVVSADVCFLPDALMRTLQEACAAAGIEADTVVVAATHTHAAPHTADSPVGRPDPAFTARLTPDYPGARALAQRRGVRQAHHVGVRGDAAEHRP